MSETPPRNITDLPNALERRDEISRRIEGKKLVVFLDYDGTLTPIRERPDLAVLSSDMRRTIRELAAHCTVAIVSGRNLDDITNMVEIDSLIYAGSHGFDIKAADGKSIRRQEGAEFRERLEEVEKILRQKLAPISGALIETKQSSIAAHYRMVAEEDVSKVFAIVADILAAYPDLRVTPGKMVYEIQPRLDWDKGKAVLWLLDVLDLSEPGVVAFYFGDDITDEDAFKAIKGKGIGIFVGDKDCSESGRSSLADYKLKDSGECGRFLKTLNGRP
jgi:trehalose-phosphatase